MSKRTNTDRQSGMILILVLVLLGLIAALVTNMLFLSRMRFRQHESLLTHAILRAALTDAAIQAMKRLADDEDLDVDHPDEPWAKSQEYTTPNGVSVWVNITDENAKFDVNNAYLEGLTNQQVLVSETLMDVLTAFGDYTPVNRAQALIDWVDADTEGFRESAWYEANERPYGCPNTWIASLSEIPSISEFSKDYLTKEREMMLSSSRRAIVNQITVIPDARRVPVPVNINSASPAVLRSLAGITQDAWVDYVIAFRIERPLTSLTSLLTLVDDKQKGKLNLYLDVKSSTFLITAKAFFGTNSEELQVLVRRDSANGSVKVLRWIMSSH